MSNEETTKINENVIDSKVPPKAAPSVEATPNGTIGTAETAPKLQPTAEPVAKKKEKLVAIYSPNNRFWDDVCRLDKGYNFINKKQADAWLTQEGIRLATPEEIKAIVPDGDED
jgi:hypothetical protein